MDIPQSQGPANSGQSGGNTEHVVAERNTPMAILAYIGPLVIVSYLVAKADPFVKFHIKQGTVLFVIELAAWIIGMMIWPLVILFNLVNICALVLSVIGIINAVQGKEKELPFIGKFSKYATF